mgnify:CR=1 FL=1
MAYLVVNGSSYEPLTEAIPTALALVQGVYYDPGRYGHAPVAGAPFYDEQDVTFDAIDGVWVVRKGFRFTPIFATLVLAGTPQYCNQTCKSLLASLRQLARYTVELPGTVQYEGCRLKESGTPTWENINGGCFLVIPCIWLQRSMTN